jgi:hypothetical protein
MIRHKSRLALVAAGMLATGLALYSQFPSPDAHAQTANRVFEIRTYTAQPGKFEAMKARFSEHIVPTMFPKEPLNITAWRSGRGSPALECEGFSGIEPTTRGV